MSNVIDFRVKKSLGIFLLHTLSDERDYRGNMTREYDVAFFPKTSLPLFFFRFDTGFDTQPFLTSQSDFKAFLSRFQYLGPFLAF